MAVYTKIGLDEINLIEKNFSIGKILNYSGIKKGIENTNYLIKSKKRKFILTIFEKRVNSRDLPFSITDGFIEKRTFFKESCM